MISAIVGQYIERGRVRDVLARAIAIGFLISILWSSRALAWGDEGHEVIALVADHFMEANVRERVHAMLDGDKDTLTAHDIASEATWADKYRDSDRGTTKKRYNRTRQWHYVALELDHPDLGSACFGQISLPPKTVASAGPADECVVDKVMQFTAELSDTQTAPAERLLALKYLLHLVGDLHQPLHAGERNDDHGNKVRVTATAFTGSNLHQFWDNEVVEELGDDPKAIADDLVGGIEQNHSAPALSAGRPSTWIMETFYVAEGPVYGHLPAPGPDGTYKLEAAYVTDAISTARYQMARGGVRLAALLNRALGGHG